MGVNVSDFPETGLNQIDLWDVDAGGTMGLKREDTFSTSEL